jgi:hypothetical protein
MQTKAQQRTEFLTSLEHEISRFKVMCDTSVCSEQFLKALHGIQAQGRYLIRGIEDLVEHASGLEDILNRYNERSLANETIDPAVSEPAEGRSQHR